MSTTAICPICHGTGRITGSPTATAINDRTCHGCVGKGWVELGGFPNTVGPNLPMPEPKPWSPLGPPYWPYHWPQIICFAGPSRS